MREARHFQKNVSTVNARASVQEIAEQMRHEGLGCLVIVDGERRPIGVVTDRDLAVRVLSAGRRAKEATAASVMSTPLVTVTPSDPIETVIERMRTHGVRRVPVVREQQVVGIVSLDDLVVQLGQELDALGTAFRHRFRDARRGSGLEGVLDEIRERLAPLGDHIERAGEKTREILLRELDVLRERLQRH
jgi:CBS domain-containing protein